MKNQFFSPFKNLDFLVLLSLLVDSDDVFLFSRKMELLKKKADIYIVKVDVGLVAKHIVFDIK